MKQHRHEDDHIIIEEETAAPHVPAMHVHPEETTREYMKFAAVILAIFIVAVGITTLRGWGGNRFANDFMAVFFMTFATFKFINLEMFVATYRTYDVIAKHLRPWPYAFPFIEAILGLCYFISTDAWQLNFITMLVTATAGYGVYKALKSKSKFHCACLGTLIRLPLTKISFVENAAMFFMAFVLFIT